ncbi:uncharacterized protein LOC132195550 [Neocloeon triangulifer]|uniref:uncharacterized protein LOC132195550 n=1 Tax=Neocloeon triangulifer TaxID=2078957 RepID=UPI00286F9713|nr:uncharacterized protein LOC132195550 [Neocloeon triangulifer]
MGAKLLVLFTLFSITTVVFGKAVPNNIDGNPLLSLFGLGGSNSNWNPLSLLGLRGEKRDESPNPAKHFASIASGVSGLMQDMMKNAAKFAEASASTTEAPKTSPKDPLIAGLELLTGIFSNKNGIPDSSKTK